MQNKNAHKFDYLDGLRGVAALVVVFHHYALGFYPAIKTGDHADLHGRFELLIYHTPLSLFFAGNFAVCIFFILSGFVLSHKFLATGERDAITSGAVRRYFRLMPPVLGSVLVAYVLLRFGLFYNLPTSKMTHSLWLSGFWQFPASLHSALYQGLYSVFLKGQSSYNTNLWTMQAEFFGSYLVFLTLALFGKMRNRWFIYGLLALFFWDTFYLAFLIGVVLSDIWTGEYREQIIRFIQKGWFAPAIILGLLLGSVPDATVASNYFAVLQPAGLDYGLFTQICHIVGGALLTLGVLAVPRLQSVLSSRAAQYLGRISFSLYVVHLCVIGSLSSYLFLSLPASLPYSIRFAITFIPSLVVVFAWSELFTRHLDQPAIRMSGMLYRRFFHKRIEAGALPTQRRPSADVLAADPTAKASA